MQVHRHAESQPLIELFKAANTKLPADLKVQYQRMHYDLYVVQVMFSVILNKDESVLEAQFGLTLEDIIDKQERKTRAIKVFHYLMICV